MPNLTELDTIKSELGITDTSEDTKLTRLIAMAGDLIENIIGRSLTYNAAHVEKVEGRGRDILYVSTVPLASIG